VRSEVSSPLSYCEVALDILLLSLFFSIMKMMLINEEEIDGQFHWVSEGSAQASL